jgi:hypothetical protein
MSYTISAEDIVRCATATLCMHAAIGYADDKEREDACEQYRAEARKELSEKGEELFLKDWGLRRKQVYNWVTTGFLSPPPKSKSKG